MRDLILTGFMGTGKSTVGCILADRFGLSFVDTDIEVERRAGCGIPEIFRRYGEAEFRRLESEVLASHISGEGRVIATGGGLLLSERNRCMLREGQEVVCLSASVRELINRLARVADRPLLGSGDARRIAALLEARKDVYGHFMQIDTTGRTPNEVAGEIAWRLDMETAGELEFVNARRTRLVFERGVASRLEALFSLEDLTGPKVLVTDDTVASLGLLEPVLASLESLGSKTHVVALPHGEEHKTLDSLQHLYGMCLDAGIDRRGVVVAVGGGVVCDVAGMLAATYVRGLRLALVPSTLLAQVDAAVGGKVGVDFRGVKNLVGAFYPAALVAIDPDLLTTLSAAALADGLAEVVKIAAVRSIDLLHMVEGLPSAVAVHLHSAIIRSAAREKLQVVQRDPYEQGDRAMLNFGHTIGHAVEAASQYQLSHGQAVSVGMAAETWLAETRGFCPAGLHARLSGLMRRFNLPLDAPGLHADEVLSYVLHDKKREQNSARFALPTGPGEGAVFQVAEADVRAAVERAVGGAA